MYKIYRNNKFKARKRSKPISQEYFFGEHNRYVGVSNFRRQGFKHSDGLFKFLWTVRGFNTKELHRKI
jgi:hypothetical protein